MDELDSKIVYLFYLIYNIEENDKVEVLEAIKDLSDDEKKTTIIALYERYEAMIKNSSILIQKLQIINNNIEEELEKVNLGEINFNY